MTLRGTVTIDCRNCGEPKLHYAQGRCQRCYRLELRARTAPQTCNQCHRERPIYARGMCRTCHRNRKEGPESRPCLHCKRMRPHKARRLCFSCYQTPGVRENYQTYRRFKVREESQPRRGPPPEPTLTPVNHPDRIEVYRQRNEAGFELHHPDDSKQRIPG